jgi:uncharacterized protein YjiS (DUF1127 family)
MTDIALNTRKRGWNFGFAIGVAQSLTRIDERYRRWRQYRTVAAELRQYSAAELTELGISEADISSVAHEAADH